MLTLTCYRCYICCLRHTAISLLFRYDTPLRYAAATMPMPMMLRCRRVFMPLPPPLRYAMMRHCHTYVCLPADDAFDNTTPMIFAMIRRLFSLRRRVCRHCRRFCRAHSGTQCALCAARSALRQRASERYVIFFFLRYALPRVTTLELDATMPAMMPPRYFRHDAATCLRCRHAAADYCRHAMRLLFTCHMLMPLRLLHARATATCCCLPLRRHYATPLMPRFSRHHATRHSRFR